MHDGVQFDPIKVKVKVTSPSKLEIRPFQKLSHPPYTKGAGN